MDSFKELVELIDKSGLFDPKFYLKEYRDARVADEEPLEHFCKIGLSEDRMPNRDFDPVWYKDFYTDVKEDGIYPLVHYILFGKAEGRLTMPQADTEEVSADLKKSPIPEKKSDAPVNPIDSFDTMAYLQANPDIEKLLNSSEDRKRAFLEHITLEGLQEIREGKRAFHIDFEPFDEELYLSLFSDVAKVVGKTRLASGFEHFCRHGYREILSGARGWKRNISAENGDMAESTSRESRKSVVAVIGIPRSGLTLATAITGVLSDATTWFLPFSTRKNFGIEIFSDYDTMKNLYREAFPGTDIGDRTVLSESTSDLNDLNKLFDSLESLKNSDVDVKLIWVLRDPRYTYLSQMEAAHRYWGAQKVDISEESFKSYVSFLKIGYKKIVENIMRFENLLLPYSAFTDRLSENIEKIALFMESEKFEGDIDYKRLKTLSVAGDPGFTTYDDIVSAKDEHRKREWSVCSDLEEKLDHRDRLFFSKFKKLVSLAESADISSVREYVDFLLRENFDTAYYLSVYKDIAKNGSDPMEHYKLYGWRENRNPCAEFETRWYRESVYSGDDILNPFEHYLLVGRFTVEPIRSFKPEYDSVVPKLKIIDPESVEVTPELIIEVPRFEKPKVSILIPQYNQENYTIACIRSIVENTEDVSYEIIVMDDKSPNPGASEIERNLKNVKFIVNGINYGFLQNCNKGTRFAEGEYILFLNNDTNVQPGWLSSLVELIESADDIGMVGSRLVYPDGRQQEAGGIVWRDASAWNFGKLDDPSKPDYNYVKEADYISGAAIMIKSSLWREIGGFDERYVPAYFEDTDLAFEVRRHGQRVMYQPKSVVIHFEGISHGTDTDSGMKRYQLINREKFLSKWKETLQREHFENGQNVFLARDKSSKRKKVLFVDHYLPHFDQDAGSKAAYQYLKILLKGGYKVYFVGDNFWHYPQTPYLEALTQLGIEVLYGNWYAKNWKRWFEENGKYFDYAILSRPHIANKYIDTVKRFSDAKVVYMGHDLHFLREYREYMVKKEEKYLQSSLEWKEREMALIEEADVSYFFSSVEKEEILKIDSTVNIDVVPLYIYEEFSNIEYSPKNRKDIMFVGGFAHTPNVDAVLWFVEKVWPKIKKKIGNLKFYIIGSKPTEDILALSSKDIVVTGYVDDETLDRYYRECRLVVAPLRYGAGIKGKIVDALYKSMPVVTTTIGAEGLDGADSCMMIADNENEFAKKTIALYKDRKMAEKISKNALEYCKKNFSQKSAIEKLSSLFREFDDCDISR